MKGHWLSIIGVTLLVWAIMPTHAQAPASAKSRVILTLDKNEFFLGENALVHYCFENISGEPIRISYGGDYRGASRSLRFKVTVTDAAGTVMPDPDPSGFSEGGIGGFDLIAAGERWCQSLPLMRYARIDKPGTYLIRVVHDMGLPSGEAPEGRVTVAFVAPSDTQAEQVVAAMMALPRDGGTVMGRLSTPYADFSALRYGVYLRPLVTRAEAGDTRALAALGFIPIPEATRALIAMLGHKDPAMARIAARTLTPRLPDPALAGLLGPRSPFVDATQSARRYLIDAGWRDEFAPDIRAAAVKLLAEKAIDDIVLGAFMLEAVGGPESAPALSAALTRAIEKTRTLPFETGMYPRPRGSAQELMRAADALVRKGYAPEAPGETPGGMALWLVAFGHGARPTDWQQHVSRALAHPIPYIREVAIDRLPTEVPSALVPAIRENLESTNADVQIAACNLVYRAKLSSVHAEVSNTLRKAKEEQAMRACGNALWALGARFERLDILAVRLSERNMTDMTLDMLLDVFENHGSTGCCKTDQGKALSVRWRAFLAAHRADIEAGRSISLDDPSVPADLVPPSVTLRRAGKPNWPPR